MTARETPREPTPPLKACPFCGMPAHAGEDASADGRQTLYAAVCADWNCSVGPTASGFKTLDEAIAAWNRRSGGSPAIKSVVDLYLVEGAGWCWGPNDEQHAAGDCNQCNLRSGLINELAALRVVRPSPERETPLFSMAKVKLLVWQEFGCTHPDCEEEQSCAGGHLARSLIRRFEAEETRMWEARRSPPVPSGQPTDASREAVAKIVDDYLVEGAGWCSGPNDEEHAAGDCVYCNLRSGLTTDLAAGWGRGASPPQTHEGDGYDLCPYCGSLGRLQDNGFYAGEESECGHEWKVLGEVVPPPREPPKDKGKP